MNEKARKLLCGFVLIQPFLDFDFFYEGRLATVLPFTIPTILRIIGVLALLGLYLGDQDHRSRLKRQYWLWAYLAVLTVYCLLHLWHAKTFKSINPSGYGYSLFGEIFYLFRMAMPLILIYLTQGLEISKELFLKVCYWVSLTFSGIIVLSNLFVVSLKSYEHGVISGNIFTWFMGPLYGYSHSASKGFFYFTNTLSAILLMLAPLVFYLLLARFKWQNCLLAVVHFLAMLEVGTKVALYGLLASMILSLLGWLFHIFLTKNESFSWKPVAVMAVLFAAFAVTYKVTPAVQRYEYEIYWAKSHDADISKENAELAAGLAKYRNDPAKLAEFEKDFLAKNYQKYALNKRFITKSYPYKYDPQFWIDMLKKPATYRLANRNVETAMLDRVVATNASPWDKWLGIGYTRETNIFNLERDFKAQAYSLGVAGTVLYLGFYLGILLYGAWEWLRFKGVRNYLVTTSLLASGMILGAGYMSGNVLDFLTSSLLLAFLDGCLLCFIRRSRG